MDVVFNSVDSGFVYIYSIFLLRDEGRILGVESMFIDILSFVIGVLFGQLVSLYVYRYTVLGRNCTVCSIVVILTMTFIFSVFTFFPPQVPLFHDKSTGIYGIYKDTN